jgi:hypothetical protein
LKKKNILDCGMLIMIFALPKLRQNKKIHLRMVITYFAGRKKPWRCFKNFREKDVTAILISFEKLWQK